MSSLKERIQEAKDIQSELVHVDEWDCDVEVRGMDGNGRAAYFEASYDEDGKPIYAETSVNILIATCFDPETGEKLFDASDKEWLSKKSGSALNTLGLKALQLSGITAEARDDIKNASRAEESESSTSPLQKS